MHILAFMLAVFLGLSCSRNEETVEIKPKKAYSEIDVSQQNQAIQYLLGKDDRLRQQTVDRILQSPNSFTPPVIYALSRVLFTQKKKDEAAFWFYVAQLRARYDANLCLDVSATQAVTVLSREYGLDVNTYTMKDIDKLERIVIRVVDFVRANEETYDHRWISLHGVGAALSSMEDNKEMKELTLPKERWPAVKKATVDNYFNQFYIVVKHRK